MFKFSAKGVKELKRDLKILLMTKADRKEVFKLTAKKIRQAAKKSINAQTSPDGKKWAPRKKPKKTDEAQFQGKTGKRLERAKQNAQKMLANRATAKNLSIKENSAFSVSITPKNPRQALISAIHQYGLTVSRKRMKFKNGNTGYVDDL